MNLLSLTPIWYRLHALGGEWLSADRFTIRALNHHSRTSKLAAGGGTASLRQLTCMSEHSPPSSKATSQCSSSHAISTSDLGYRLAVRDTENSRARYLIASSTVQLRIGMERCLSAHPHHNTTMTSHIFLVRPLINPSRSTVLFLSYDR